MTVEGEGEGNWADRNVGGNAPLSSRSVTLLYECIFELTIDPTVCICYIDSES